MAISQHHKLRLPLTDSLNLSPKLGLERGFRSGEALSLVVECNVPFMVAEDYRCLAAHAIFQPSIRRDVLQMSMQAKRQQTYSWWRPQLFSFLYLCLGATTRSSPPRLKFTIHVCKLKPTSIHSWRSTGQGNSRVSYRTAIGQPDLQSCPLFEAGGSNKTLS
jgi:hypothetical protein